MVYDKYKEYYLILDKYLIDFKNNRNNYNLLISELNYLYTFLKIVSLDFYKDGKMNKYYNLLSTKADVILNFIPEFFIIESTPIFSYKKNRDTLNSNVANKILEWIVTEARSRFIESAYRKTSYKSREDIFKRISLIDECGNISDIVKLVCLENNIDCKTLCIYPGFDQKANLYNGYRFHYFDIVTIKNEEYIIDLSYRQFFLLSLNLLNRIGVIGLGNSSPGSYMLLNKNRLETANEILKKGYVKLDNITGKCYFDGFALSFRNGHFYEQTNDFSYTTFYTLDDYKRFLDGEDNQINHESNYTLKLQSIPIKDPFMDFSYKKI